MPVVTHMKAQGLEQGTAARLLAMMQDATKRGPLHRGRRVSVLAGQTSLGALLVPAWAQDGGRDEMLKRLKDPPQRARIALEIETAMQARFGGPEGVFLPAARLELVDLMREQRASQGKR